MATELVDMDGNVIQHSFEEWLTTAEVAQLMRVHPRTVGNWANEGRLRYKKTMGGHRRYPVSAVRAAMEGDYETAANGEPTTDLIVIAER